MATSLAHTPFFATSSRSLPMPRKDEYGRRGRTCRPGVLTAGKRGYARCMMIKGAKVCLRAALFTWELLKLITWQNVRNATSLFD